MFVLAVGGCTVSGGAAVSSTVLLAGAEGLVTDVAAEVAAVAAVLVIGGLDGLGSSDFVFLSPSASSALIVATEDVEVSPAGPFATGVSFSIGVSVLITFSFVSIVVGLSVSTFSSFGSSISTAIGGRKEGAGGSKTGFIRTAVAAAGGSKTGFIRTGATGGRSSVSSSLSFS